MTLVFAALLLAQSIDHVPMAVAEHADPLTDKVAVMALTTTGQNAIAVACEKNSGRVKVLFQSSAFLKSTTWLKPMGWLSYRFDQDTPVSLEWWYSEHQAYIRDRGNVAPFVRRMLTASKVFLRAETYNGQNVDVTFNLEQAEPAIRSVLQKCGDVKLTAQVFGTSAPK